VRDNPGDDRDCYVKSTLCKELAFMLTIYSPIQMAADLIENYEGHPAFQFIEDVATDWSDSKVMHAKIGDYYTVARRERGTDNWFIGSVTDENGRDLELDLSEILSDGVSYQATIYADGKDAHWKENPEVYKISKRTVSSKDKIVMHLAPGGGQAIIIKKI
ncbi:MAG: glycoside hydrolase family 97 C-terminal domain-containing protein, partial [Rikenellaceae bacterium]